MKKMILFLCVLLPGGNLIQSYAQCPNPVSCSQGGYGDIVDIKLGGIGGTQSFTRFDYYSQQITLYKKLYVNGNTQITGLVGIGTIAPTANLHIYNAAAWGGTLKIQGGTSTSGIGGIDLLNDAKNGWKFNVMGSNRAPEGGVKNALEIGHVVNGTFVATHLTITPAGNVGIGTDKPSTTAKLSVAGKIEAEEIEVKDVGADFVFDVEYELKSLYDLEKYIIENRHLPGIAPAEVTEQGVNLGEFNELLLMKIEELTLYIIELNREIDSLKQNINE